MERRQPMKRGETAAPATSSARERFRQRLNQQDAGGGAWAVDSPQDRTIILKDNRTGQPGVCIKRFDFLPYITSNNPEVNPGEIWMRRQYGVHRGIGIEPKTRLCLMLSFNKPCPVDKYQAEMYKKAQSKEEKDSASAFYHKKRELYNVLDLDDEDKGVQVFDISYHLFGKMLKGELDSAPNYKYDGFWELKGGFTLTVRFRKKTFKDTEFYEAERIDFEPRADYDEDVLKETFDLDQMLKALTYEQLEKEFLQIEDIPEGEEKAEEGESEAPPEPPRKPLRRTAPPKEEAPEEKSEKVPFSKQDEEPPVEDKRTLRRAARQASTGGDDPNCPKGHKWGIDTDGNDDCVKCPKETYDECGKAYDERVKKK